MRGVAADRPTPGRRNRGAWRGWVTSIMIPVAAANAACAPRAAARAAGCLLVASTSGPPRQILRCTGGPTVEAEDGAAVQVQDPGGQGRPVSTTVGSGAALVEVPPGYPGGFQILAPRAIASVRGTVWVVDAQAARTSVFVLRGNVEVRRAVGGEVVTLGRGQGVDVADDAQPLRVTRWPRARAAALLARFGR